ncbi:hypothetical protein DFH11DRAFT_1576163 [Phellopilus nigrolimitatus]|nr:hypothetical protein DFH11DRAFT_1576163 [Phellopilus nigrolimitatus]
MADFNFIATEFTKFYYSQFDADRASLRPLYRNHSMLTWEGEQVQGVDSILERLSNLSFQTVKHQVSTIDAQPSSPTIGSLLVSVSGLLVVDGGEHPLQFSQVFHLIPDEGSYYVYNDIFRLNLG